MTSPSFDKERAEPDIIDNRAHHMADVLNMNLDRVGFLDVSSGYFEVSGYGAVREALERAVARPSFTFRLLLGKDAIRPPAFDTFEEYRRYASTIPETVKSSLEGEDLGGGRMGDIMGLIRLLRRDNVQVRLGRSRFNHAKCYILGQEGAVIGSSNFTGAGLSGNDELNAGIFVTSTWKKVRNWYERMWDGARDAKAEMLQVLEQSKFGVPATPYEVYLKILFEKYKRMLTAMEGMDDEASPELPKFQQDAVSVLLQTIDERGGAMLADSTGLGKTHIGLEVMRRKKAEKRKVLLIAPAQVRDTVWADRLEELQLNSNRMTVGIEALGRRDFDVFKYRKYDFVVIDESQNFRARTTGRRQNLMKLLSLGPRKQVLLLSATPVNNSIMDLYYQVSIITGERDEHFADIGIPNLYEYLRKAAGHKIDEGLENIQLLLDTIMVRRTRTFIREAYPDATLGGRPVTFPERVYQPIRYGLTDLFGNVYQDLLNTINSLHMTPYGIERYNRNLTDEEKRRHAVLAHLQVILLLKRFESSANAVTISIRNKIALFEYFGRLLGENRIVSPKDLNRLMLRWNAREMDGDSDESEPDDEQFMDEIRGLPLKGAGEYDVDLMRRHVKSDLGHLRRYRDSLAGLKKFDRKADAVAETILRDKALETGGHKVLVFTEYTATATYLRDYLKDKFEGSNVALITGAMKRSERPKLLRAFSPVANASEEGEPPEKEIDILVSTEVLSEGQNLQDCNYVVNYDLPWNPMRLVQRIGRVDRLTSTHPTVHSRECFPDAELDDLLNLVGKLMEKIGDINETVGLDADLLGQEASPKNFQGTTAARLRVLAGEGDSTQVTGALERESDLMPTLSPINEISRHIRRTGVMKMEEFPMGRRTGKAGEGRKAVLAYLRERPRRTFYSVVFDYAKGGAKVVDDMEAIKLARCAEDEATYLPMDAGGDAESFRQLLEVDAAAREAITLRNSEDNRIAADLRARPKKNEMTVEAVRSAIVRGMEGGGVTVEDLDEVDAVLDSADLRQWAPDLERLLAEYEAGGDAKRLVSVLKRLGRDIGAEGEREDAMAEGEPGRLALVGAAFITGGKDDVAGLGKFS